MTYLPPRFLSIPLFVFAMLLASPSHAAKMASTAGMPSVQASTPESPAFARADAIYDEFINEPVNSRPTELRDPYQELIAAMFAWPAGQTGDVVVGRDKREIATAADPAWSAADVSYRSSTTESLNQLSYVNAFLANDASTPPAAAAESPDIVAEAPAVAPARHILSLSSAAVACGLIIGVILFVRAIMSR
jgi:hypothetical protein